MFKKIYILLTILPFFISTFSYPFLPTKIPAHYQLSGEVDRWGSRAEIFIIPVFCIIISLLFALSIKDTHKQNSGNSKKIFYILGCSMLIVFNIIFFCMLTTSFSCVEKLPSLQSRIGTIINIAIGFSLIVIGNILPKVKQNSVLGLRTKWSMTNDICWNLSQRFSGLSFLITGLLIIITSLIISNYKHQIIILFVLISLNTIFSVVYSYKVYLKHGKAD